MAAKLRSIKTGALRKTTTGRVKVICGCSNESTVNYHFKLTDVDGRREAECPECLGDLEPTYTAEAVKAMIDEAVTKAREEWEAIHAQGT